MEQHQTVDAVTMQILETAFIELQALVKGLRQINENGAPALLEIMLTMKESALEYQRRNSYVDIRSADSSITVTSHFEQTIQILRKSCSDGSYLERREPKLSKLKEILCEHFHRHEAAAVSTRVLVFANLRAVVHEIKSELNEVRGVIAHEFVGQGTTKSTSASINGYDGEEKCPSKGLNQSDQARILRDFNAGVYNVLVATSIAEEGLDIAEVDLIVFFEAVASSIRLVQRCGRTGRKRDGRVVILISEGVEEFKVDKSSDDAVSLGKTLRNASRSLQLYQDSPNMFPPGWPQPIMQMVDIKIRAFRPDAIAGGMTKVGARTSKDRTDTTSAADNREKADALIKGAKNGSINRPAVHPQPSTDSSKGSGISLSIAKYFSNPIALPHMKPAAAVHPREVADRAVSKGWDGRSISQPSNAVLHDETADQTKDTGIDLTVDDDSLFAWSFVGIRQDSIKSMPTNNPPKAIIKNGGKLSSNNLMTSSSLWSSSMLNHADIADIIDGSEDIDSDLFFEAHSRGSHRSAYGRSSRPALMSESASTIISTSGGPNDTPAIVDLTVEANNASCSRGQQPICHDDKIDAPMVDAARSISGWSKEAVGSQRSCFSNLTSIVRSASQSRSFLVDDGDDDDSIDADTVDAMGHHEASSHTEVHDGVDITSSDAVAHALEDPGTACSSPTNIATNATTLPTMSDDTIGSDSCTQCDMNHICHACLDWESYEDDPIVFCDGLCGSCVHVSCYGILTNGVPEGDFHCESCEHLRICRYEDPRIADGKPSCALCFQSTGSMKRCHRGLLWTHPLCVYFTPELTVASRTNRLNNIELLNQERKQLVCDLCKETGGAVVQCAYKDCLVGFHPYCAFQGRLQMIVRQGIVADTGHGAAAGSELEDASTSYELYCRRHSDKYLQVRGSTITGSRNPLKTTAVAAAAIRSSRRTAREAKQCTTTKKRGSIGIADLSSGDDGSMHGVTRKEGGHGACDMKGSIYPPHQRYESRYQCWQHSLALVTHPLRIL